MIRCMDTPAPATAVKPCMVHIRLEPAVHKALVALAERRERSLAHVIGKALERYVADSKR